MKTSALLKWRHYVIERPFLLSVLIFFAAFLPRLAAVGRYITPDELIWVYRSINFREAIIDGRWADTLLAGHPGVITMWLGTIGTSLQLLLNPADREVYQWITQLAWLTPDNMAAFQRLSAFLTSGRIAVAIVSSLGIVLIYWLARRLTDDILAVLLVVFLLLDPFLAGLSGLLHVDGLVTTFVTLSLLSLALLFATDKKGEAAAVPSGLCRSFRFNSGSRRLGKITGFAPLTGHGYCLFLEPVARSGGEVWRSVTKNRCAWCGMVGELPLAPVPDLPGSVVIPTQCSDYRGQQRKPPYGRSAAANLFYG